LEQKESYLVCLYQAKSYDRLTYYSSAVSACERAIQVYPYLAEPFALELKIFRKLNQFEMMGDIIERFEQLGYNSDQVLYYKAELLFEAEQYEACWRCLNQILSRRNQGETDLRDYEAVYRLQSSVYERMKLSGEE
jgi:tetratricopeptide (TPR) repeat protein